MKTTASPFVLPATAACVGWAISIGCHPQARERWRQFFFDVPAETESDSTAPAVSTSPLAKPVPATFALAPGRFAVVHNPVLTRECEACHDPANSMAPREELADACRTCHAEFASLEEGHAPAAVGECLTCHEVHRSHLAGLLRQPALQLCIQCHEEPEDLSEEAHGVVEVDRCTNCHDPHFGTAPFLKPGYEEFLVVAAVAKGGEGE